jgi:hypothetical protein
MKLEHCSRESCVQIIESLQKTLGSLVDTRDKDEALLQQALDALVWANEYLETFGETLFPYSKKVQSGSTSWHVQKSIKALQIRLGKGK